MSTINSLKDGTADSEKINTSPSDESSLSDEARDTTAPSIVDVAPAAFKPSRGFFLAFASLAVVTLAAALDATSLSIALPIITGKLHGTAIEAFWSGTSFLLTSAVFQPVIAGLSHVFGRKEVYEVYLEGRHETDVL